MKNPENRALELELNSDDIAPSGDQELRLLRRLYLSVKRDASRIVIVSLGLSVLAMFATFLVTPEYMATAKVMLNTRENVAQDFSPDISGLPTDITSLESELEVLRSTDLIERVVKGLELVDDPAFADDGFSLNPISWLRALFRSGASAADDEQQTDVALEETIKAIRDLRSVEQVGTTSAVYAIHLTTNDRFLSAKIANALANEYLATQTVEKIRSLERSQGWLAERTAQLQTDLNDLDAKLEARRLEAPFSDEEYATVKAQRLLGVRDMRTLMDKTSALEAKIAEMQALAQGGQVLDAALLVEDPDDDLRALVELEQAGGSADIAARLGERVEAEIARDQATMEDLQRRREALQQKIDLLRQNQAIQANHDAEVRRIENEITVNEAIYRDFVSQLSRQTENNEYLDADGRIIEFARPPTDRSSPRRGATAVTTLLLTIFGGALFAMLREAFETRLRTTQEIEEAVGRPLHGVLPYAGPNVDLIGDLIKDGRHVDSNLMRFARKLKVSLDAVLAGETTAVEAPVPTPTKGARARAATKQRGAIIAGVSAMPNEGLSSSLLLLAHSYAQVGEQVLVLDCDFWASAYGEHASGATLDPLTIEKSPSVVDPLILSTATPGLHVLPALVTSSEMGNNGPELSEYYGTRSFRRLLEYLAEKYDKVFIDTPPLLPVMDAVSILPHADKVIYFVRWNATQRDAVISTVSALEDVNIEPAFGVATQVRFNEIGLYGDNSMASIYKAQAVRATDAGRYWPGINALRDANWISRVSPGISSLLSSIANSLRPPASRR
jgi:polysaccharide biosynthesis transport protein